MRDAAKTNPQQAAELISLRQRVAELEARLHETERIKQQLELEIKKREQFEQTLIEERNMMRSLIDHIPDHIYVKNNEGRFIINNSASLRYLGVTTQQELRGKTDFDLLPAELAAKYRADEQSLLRSGQPLINREEEAYVAATDTKKWLLTTKVPLQDSRQKIIGLVGVSRDVTELKEAKDAIAISRDTLQSLIQQLPIGVQVFDTQGQCIDVNKAHMRIFGVDKPEQLIGRYNLFIDPMAEQVGTQEAFRHVLTGHVVHLPEVLFDPKQADPRFAQMHQKHILAVTFFPVRNLQGEIVQLVALNEDITERKQLEEQLRQAQKMEAVGQLAGGVAHNFNNMLTAMMGYTSLALEALPSEHPAYKDLQGIQKITQRATGLTQQLLAFTRHQVMRPRVLNLNEMVLRTNALLRQLIPEAIELVTHAAPDLGSVTIDPGQLEQVLINLAVNARDAMPAGGLITIETANVTFNQPYVDPYTEISPGDYVVLTVCDSGTGMTEEVKRRIFEPFFTTKEVGQGTGLGLSTCFGIVKQNNGHLTVHSTPGQGTTFRVYFPRVPGWTHPLLNLEKTGEPGQGTETILLVEDETAVGEMASRILRQQGYTVLTTHNAEDALDIVGQEPGQPIHLLLTDVVLPKMGGQILAERLKVNYPAIKILFISGYTDKSIVHDGILDPSVSFLPKPFTPDSLARKVRAVLDGEVKHPY